MAIGALHVTMATVRASPSVGGIQTHVHEVAPRLAAAGVDVTILTTDPTGTLPPREEQNGVRVRRLRGWPPGPDFTVAPGLARALHQDACDLVHVQGCHTLFAPAALLAAVRTALPFVVSFHSAGHSSRLRGGLRFLQWEFLRPFLLRARALIVVSEFERQHLARRLRLPVDRFTVIPNGAQLPGPVVAPTERRGSDPLILSVGRLERYKGHHRAIAAMPALLERAPSARLLIVGSGPYESELRRLVRRLGVTARVQIQAVPAGDRQQMAALVAGASLVVLLSEYESQGIGALEAVTLGRPVLVADTSALRELRRYEAVRTIPLESDADQLAAAMLEHLERRVQRDPPQVPSWDDCAAETLGMYRSVTRSEGRV